jgi:hypothetical protein
MTKSRMMKFGDHVAGMRRTGMHVAYWWKSRKEVKRRWVWVSNLKMDVREI